MRQRLLQHLSFAKPLRLALVLFTLLLTLPQNVWGSTSYGSNTAVNTTNNTWGDWKLSDGPTYTGYNSGSYPALNFANASTITLTLTRPANNTDYVELISVQVEDGTTLQSAMMGTTDIKSSFQLNANSKTYTSGASGPVEWTGDITITLQGTNNAGSVVVALVNTVNYYGVTVAGVPVTENNYNTFTGSGISGTISYNDNSRTLTLNNAAIDYTTGDVIIATITNPLNIDLVGTNSISCGDNKAFNTGGNLNFQGTGTYPGQLTITSTSSITPQNYYTCTGSVTYQNGLVATSLTSSSVLISTNYGINVGGTEVTSANATNVLNNNTVSYDAIHNILTLDGARISGAISTELDNLTIKLKGTNTITTTTTPGKNGIISNKNTGTLTFTKEGASASLTIASNVSVIRGFASLGLENSGLYTNTSTPYKIKSDSSYPRLADATKEESDTTYSITNIIIGDVVTYQLWVAGNQATYSNASNVTGAQTPTVAFNATDNILTLNGFSVNAPIFSNLDNLTILFQGDNNLGNNSSGASGYISSLNTNAPLILKGGTGNCTLVLDDDYGHAVISGFASVTFDGSYLTSNNSCGYATGTDPAIRDVKGGIVQSATITTTPHYPLWISSTQVTPTNNTNVLRDATVSFDYDSRTLTLNGTSISNSNAIESWLDKLIINLKGNNNVSTYTYGYSAICSGIETATLTIAKDATATGDVQLSLNTGGNPLPPIIKGFKSVDYTGLNFVSKTATAPDAATATDGVFSSGTIYPLWIGGVWVTEANKSFNGTTSGTLVYDGNSNTITMTDYVSTFTTGHAIETGINGLIVKLVGSNNAITCNDANGYAFYNGSGNTDASIQFTKEATSTTSKLTLQTTPTNPFGGFANGSITYNGLVYYPTGKYIAIPTAPTMTEDNDKVKLDRDAYEGGTIAIKYSIAYADGKTADITDATYSAPFAMAAPGTVTAWVEANGANSDETKGKYFGFKDAPFTMKAGDTKTVELIPAFEASDNIGYNATGTYESDATGVATFTGGTITAVAIGTATVTANIDYSSNTTPVVILNPNKKVTAVVNVGVVPSITFQDGMQYATYCNTTGTDMTVPAGLTAYAITGVNENVVTLAEVNFLPKVDGTTYVPLLLKRDDTSTTVGLALEATGGTRPTTNYLIYNNTGAAINVSDNWYVLYKNEFIKATGSIPDGKCYLDLTGAAPAPARSLGIDSDGTTDIRELRMENEERDEWYDLQGRRIEQPTKAGLYIKNGKKVIVNTK